MIDRIEELLEDLININVIIADRPYPLKIKKEEEESVRKAAKTINDKIKEYQQLYAAKDKQDYLAMTALMYAVEAALNEDKVVIADEGVTEKLDELDKLLDTSLKA